MKFFLHLLAMIIKTYKLILFILISLFLFSCASRTKLDYCNDLKLYDEEKCNQEWDEYHRRLQEMQDRHWDRMDYHDRR